jgi:hypothetical protein
MLAEIEGPARQAQRATAAPLSAEEQAILITLMARLVRAHTSAHLLTTSDSNETAP